MIFACMISAAKIEYIIFTVQITIKDDIITTIEIVPQNEDDLYFSDACAVIDDIPVENPTDADTVSGGTISSGGISDAVSKALEAARIPWPGGN